MYSDAVLNVQDLSKEFGGLVAVNGVNLKLLRGEIHAIIGPNGAGKTTFLNLLSGELLPGSGRLMLDGADVTGWSSDALCRAGIGRSFQHSSVMGSFSIFENVRLAAQAGSPFAFSMLRSARSLELVNREAEEALSIVGLKNTQRSAAEISHGEQRQLEIAMLLATRSKLLMLDEPTSGMGRYETNELIDVLEKLRGERTILMVEHDMDVVFSLADRITVLVYGRVMATGTPDEVRANDDVRKAYLGENK